MEQSFQTFQKKLDETNKATQFHLEMLIKEIQQVWQWSQNLSVSKEKEFQLLQKNLQEKCQQLFSKVQELRLWSKEESSNLLKEYQRLTTQFEEITSRCRYFKTLYETGLAANAELDLKKLLEFAMEAAIEMTAAKRGFLALVDEKEELKFIVARNMDKEKIDHPEYEVNRDIVQEVLRSGQPIELDDTIANNHFKNKNSISKLRLRSVLSVPLKFDGEILGVIYLDNEELRKCFSKDSLALLLEFAKQISAGVKNAVEYKTIRDAHTKLMERLRASYEFSHIIGKSTGLRTVLETIAQVADTHANVLIQGESGTGKELVAQAIHFNSSRREQPFIVVNAGAIPENLLESELFGYEKGAFTGAMNSKPGKFELADGGTIFLDEIADMSPQLQGKILRTIQNREIERLGGTRVIPVDVRILAATNKDLLRLIKQGKFRKELYYRLNIVNIALPALRERKEDIPLLANHFLKKYADREHKNIQAISFQALEILETYNWPGNVRELENVIERAVILCHEKEIGVVHLPREIVGLEPLEMKEHHHDFTEAVNEFKKLLVLRTLQETGNNKAEAARRLSLNRTYFFRLLEQLEIR